MGIDLEREAYELALSKLTKEQVEKFSEEGEMPESLKKIVEINPLTNDLMSRKFKEVALGTINDILDKEYDFFFEGFDDDSEAA